ncbi:MAG: hypothetical protein ACLFSP_12550 [Spirochaetaceae bacterium]
MSANYYNRKDQLLNSLLKWILILGAVAYVPSLIAAIVDKLYVVALVDTIVYVTLLILFFCPRTGYHVRLFGTVIGALILGAVALFETGTDGAGHIWLLCGVFIAALFGRAALVVIAIVVTQLVFATYGFLVVGDVIDHGTPVTALFAVAANMLVVSIVLAAVTHGLLRYLQRAMSSQETTLKLLDHRIRNNLRPLRALLHWTLRYTDVPAHWSVAYGHSRLRTICSSRTPATPR